MTRTLLLAALIAVPLIAACGSPDIGSTSVLCRDGDLLETDGLGTLCVYSGPITETRFTCPSELPHRHELEPDLFVCAAEELPDDQLEDELRDRGYLDPPDVDPNDGGPVNNGQTNNGQTNNGQTNNGQTNNGQTNNGAPMCEPGDQQVCHCGNGIPGVTVCVDGGTNTWSECACPLDWTVPGVNEVQPAPVDCTEPAEMLALPADLDNVEPLGQPCLAERFIEGCPVIVTLAEWRGELPLVERVEVRNQAVYDRIQGNTFYLYDFGGPYEQVWDYGDDDRVDTLTRDAGLDGVIDITTTTTWDGQGRQLTERTVGEGYSSVQGWTWDDEGRVVRQESTFSSEQVVNTYITVRTWREDGTLAEELTTLNGEREAWILRTFNDEGQLVQEAIRGLDGIGQEIDYTYREDGSLERTVTHETSIAIDENDREFRYLSEVIERLYDERGNELQSIHDSLGNGLAKTTILRTWDAWDRVLTESYGPLAGPPEVEWVLTYAPEGGPLLTSVRTEIRSGRDHITTTTWDGNRNPTLIEKRESGTDRLLERSVYTWTEGGEPLSTETDHDGDGTLESRVRWIRDAGGNLLDHHVDQGADGFIEDRTAYRYRCE